MRLIEICLTLRTFNSEYNRLVGYNIFKKYLMFFIIVLIIDFRVTPSRSNAAANALPHTKIPYCHTDYT